MKSNPALTLVVWVEIALFIGAVLFMLIGALYYFVNLVILPLF